MESSPQNNKHLSDYTIIFQPNGKDQMVLKATGIKQYKGGKPYKYVKSIY